MQLLRNQEKQSMRAHFSAILTKIDKGLPSTLIRLVAGRAHVGVLRTQTDAYRNLP